MSLPESPLIQALRGRRVRTAEVAIVSKDGKSRRFFANGTPMVDDTGKALGAVMPLHDVTAQLEAEAQLDHQSLHDALTGLPNRTLFLDRVTHALKRAGREQTSTALLYLDVDRLRTVSGNLGYDCASELLVELARNLRQDVRPYDTVARLGGDEFGILCEMLNDDRGAVAIADRALEAIQRPVHVGGEKVSVTATMGIAIAGPGNLDSARLIGDAELAMRRAKEQGRPGSSSPSR
jgi:diguanylate cyclase (GGDEF)-like protein